MPLLALVAAAFTAESAAAQQKTLAARIMPLVHAHRGRVAVAVRHLDTGESFHCNEDDEMPTASLIKFMLMLEVYLQASEGNLRLADMITLRKADMVPGSGILAYHFSDGATFSVRDAARLMIVYSDNTAANLILDRIGVTNTNRRLDSWGLSKTRVYSKFYQPAKDAVDPARLKKFGVGSTSARETLLLLEKVHRGKVVDAAACRDMLDHLKHCDDRLKLKKFLPEGIEVAHKSGTIAEARTDAGILYLPKGPVAICVLTDQNEDRSFREDNDANVLIGRIAREVVDHFAAAPMKKH
jgi:beta-lactamase class A